MIKKIPAETATYHFYNANAKGKFGDDCAIRAISTALNQPWEQTVREMTEVGIKYGYVLNDKKCIKKYLALKGWAKHSQPRKQDNTKYTGSEWCTKLQTAISLEQSDPLRLIVANIGGHHMVAIVDGKVYDTWNSTNGCIGMYWTK